MKKLKEIANKALFGFGYSMAILVAFQALIATILFYAQVWDWLIMWAKYLF